MEGRNCSYSKFTPNCLVESIESCLPMEVVAKGQSQPRISPKRMKFQKIVEDGGEDRISALLDCLRLEILSRLPSTTDAIRTGTVSKRWKHLWTMVSTLIFEHYDRNHPWPDFVDKTLTQCRQLKLKKFHVHTSFVIQFESQVKNWILYAVRRNVEELNLKLWNTESEVEILLDQYFFTNSSFTDLTLEGFMFNPIGAISWKNLTRLCIFYGKLDEDLVENILSGSPLLETLVLHRCYGYRVLDITSKSVKKLVFSGYMDPEDEYDDIIEINAPNIQSLTIQGGLFLSKLLLVNVSSLVEANLDYTFMGYWETTLKEAEEEMLKGFIVNLRHVKELKIRVFCSKALSRLEAKGFIFPSIMKLFDVTPPSSSDNDSGDWSDSDSVESGE